MLNLSIQLLCVCKHTINLQVHVYLIKHIYFKKMLLHPKRGKRILYLLLNTILQIPSKTKCKL